MVCLRTSPAAIWDVHRFLRDRLCTERSLIAFAFFFAFLTVVFHSWFQAALLYRRAWIGGDQIIQVAILPACDRFSTATLALRSSGRAGGKFLPLYPYAEAAKLPDVSR